MRGERGGVGGAERGKGAGEVSSGGNWMPSSSKTRYKTGTRRNRCL